MPFVVTINTLEQSKESITEQKEQEDNSPVFLKDALYQGEPYAAPYPITVASPKIDPMDKSLMKANAHESMQNQAEQQISMLQKQATLLMNQAKEIQDRLKVSHTIYQADMNFEPVVGTMYHLYQREDESWLLSMIAPYEWGKKIPFTFLHTVRLLADKTWDILA